MFPVLMLHYLLLHALASYLKDICESSSFVAKQIIIYPKMPNYSFNFKTVSANGNIGDTRAAVTVV